MQDSHDDVPLKTTDILNQWLFERQTAPSHRQLLVIAGSADFCRDIARELTRNSGHSTILSIGESSLKLPNSRPLKYSSSLLGQECDLALYDAFDAIRPNAILALAGTLKNAGIMVFCCPELDNWPRYKELSVGHYLSYGEDAPVSKFRQQLASRFSSDESINILTEHNGARLTIQRPLTYSQRPEPPFKTPEQSVCFQQLTSQPTTRALITADRGRGKSVLMGLVAGWYMQQGYHVLITSRYSEATTQVFYGITLLCPDAIKQSNHQLTLGATSCKWVPLDHPFEHSTAQTPTRLKTVLLIDEAAAIPIPQLKFLCGHPGPLFLSTTMRGYEGSGRGFINRFSPWAKQHLPNLKHCTLNAPVRWFWQDPVEEFWYQTFHLTADLLEADVNITQTQPLTQSDISIVKLDKSALSPAVCHQIIPLLMQSHYQTTADELVRLADSPNNHIIVAVYNNTIIGVVNFQQEGGKDLKALATEICSGSRRVNGHLSAQSLALMSANPKLALLTYWRVIRIAVAHKFRRYGVGSEMLKALNSLAQDTKVDALTTSFGATPGLVSFWQQQQFIKVKPGLKKDASSGEYSLLMMQAISEQAMLQQPLMSALFQQELLLHPLSGNFSGEGCQYKSHELAHPEQTYQAILTQVIQGKRKLQHANAAIAWLISTVQNMNLGIASNHIDVIEKYVKSINTPRAFIDEFNLSGKRAVDGFVTDHLKAVAAILG